MSWRGPTTDGCEDIILTAYSYKLVAIKLMTASKEHLEKHYADLSDKPFFKGLVSCMSQNDLSDSMYLK